MNLAFRGDLFQELWPGMGLWPHRLCHVVARHACIWGQPPETRQRGLPSVCVAFGDVEKPFAANVPNLLGWLKTLSLTTALSAIGALDLTFLSPVSWARLLSDGEIGAPTAEEIQRVRGRSVLTRLECIGKIFARISITKLQSCLERKSERMRGEFVNLYRDRGILIK